MFLKIEPGEEEKMRPYIYKTESKHIYRLIIAGATRIALYRERRIDPGVFGTW